MECPVCGKEYKSISSHFSKTDCSLHRLYVDIHLKSILKRFKLGVCVKDLKTNLISYNKLVLFLRENSDYYLVVNKNNSIRSKNRKFALKNKTKDKRGDAIKLFSTLLSISKITKILGCHEKTLKNIWREEFGQEKVDERCNRIKYLHLKLSKEYCTILNRDKESYKLVVSLFNSNKSVNEIGRLGRISAATVVNIWKRVFGLNAYNKRKRRIKKEQLKQNGCCRAGSKNEILCYRIIKEKYPKTIHHDYSIVDGLEIDITIPNKHTAINWDGPTHRRPIFGEKSLKRTEKNDRIKNETLIKNGWLHIIVEDDGKHDPQFVNKKVKEIYEIINNHECERVVI